MNEETPQWSVMMALRGPLAETARRVRRLEANCPDYVVTQTNFVTIAVEATLNAATSFKAMEAVRGRLEEVLETDDPGVEDVEARRLR